MPSVAALRRRGKQVWEGNWAAGQVFDGHGRANNDPAPAPRYLFTLVMYVPRFKFNGQLEVVAGLPYVLSYVLHTWPGRS